MGTACMHGQKPLHSKLFGALAYCRSESPANSRASDCYCDKPLERVASDRESPRRGTRCALEFEAVLVRKCVAGEGPEGAGRQQPAASGTRAAGMQWSTDEDRLPLLRRPRQRAFWVDYILDCRSEA